MTPARSMRIAVRTAAVASATAVAAFGLPAAGAAAERPPVVRQTLDDDCGAAALSTALALVGVNVSEAELLRGHVGDGHEGLRAVDLIAMADRAALAYGLQGKRVRHDRFQEAIGDGPAIVLFQEQDESTGYGFGHYVVVEAYSPVRGYLVADPAFGERGWVSEADMMAKANKLDKHGQPHLLALLLVDNVGVQVGAQPIQTADEQRYLHLDSLKRVRRALPPGRTSATLSIGTGGSIDPIPGGDSLVFSSPASDVGLEVRTGIGGNRDLAIGIVGVRSAHRLMYQGETALELGRQSGIAQVSVVASQTVALQKGRQAQVWGGILFDGHLKPETFLFGAAYARPFEGFTLTGSLDARVEHQRGSTHVAVNPAVSLNFDGWRALNVDVSAGFRVGTDDHRITPNLGIAVGRSVGQNLTVSAGYSYDFLANGGHASRAQLAITYILPKKITGR